MKRFFILFVSLFGVLNSQEVSSKHMENMKEEVELIRASVMQQEQLDSLLNAFAQQAIATAQCTAKVDEVIAKTKETILSDLFLKKYAKQFRDLFTSEEMKALISFFNNKAVKKYYANAQQAVVPIYMGIQEVINEIVKPPVEVRGNITAVTTENFQKLVKKSTGRVLLEASSTFCGPCKQIDPIFSKLSLQYGDKFNFLKLNIDTESSLAKDLEIHSVPSILFIDNGKIVERHIGAIGGDELIEKIGKIFSQ
jgi:thioredoxin